MELIIIALITALFFALYNFLIKSASDSINHILGAVILQIVAAIAGIIYFYFSSLANNSNNINFNKKGIILSIAAGLSIGIAEILTFYVFSKGLNASIGTPLIVGSSILFTTILSLIFLKEELSLVQWLGIFTLILGIYLISFTNKS